MSNIIPDVSNDHPKLFILNTYYVDSTLIKSYFMRNGNILRFFPEHMETVWVRHFLISESEANVLTNEHKYRHCYGLQLPDSLFCTLYYSITHHKFLSTHYYRRSHVDEQNEISLQHITTNLQKLKDANQDSRTMYLLKRFIKANEQTDFDCIVNKNTIECAAVDRLGFMLERLQLNEIDLLGYILNYSHMNNKYSLKQFFEDIDHIEIKHFQHRSRLQQHILNTNNEMHKCFINLACWSLRRFTRSDKNYFSGSVSTNIQYIEENLIKFQKATNISLTVVEKHLDTLHCTVFHSGNEGKRRTDFRRLYIDYKNYWNETSRDLINYIHEITFNQNKDIDDDIKCKLQILINTFKLTPPILRRAPQKDIEDLIVHKSNIDNIKLNIHHVRKCIINKINMTPNIAEMKDENNKFDNVKHVPTSDVFNEALPLYAAVDVDEWLMRKEPPYHQSLEHELLCNSECPISMKTFADHHADCLAKYQNKRFNTEKLSVTDILALSSFTDFDPLQKILSKCYWEKKYFDKRNQFYHWANKLKQAIHYVGKKCSGNVWRGVNSLVQFESLNPVANQPTSFTFTQTIAEGFAEDAGIIMKCTDVIGIMLSKISLFADEDEFWSYGDTFKIQKIIIKTPKKK
eukprot:78520_1